MISRSIPLGSVCLALLLVTTAVARPGGRPGTVGKYDLAFNGDFAGSGEAHVNPVKVVSIQAELKSDAGGAATLRVRNLDIEDGKFNGTGTLGGVACTVSGRVDGPEGGVVAVARMSVIIKTSDGRVTRAFGELK